MGLTWLFCCRLTIIFSIIDAFRALVASFISVAFCSSVFFITTSDELSLSPASTGSATASAIAGSSMSDMCHAPFAPAKNQQIWGKCCTE
jgi:hypothetical protein